MKPEHPEPADWIPYLFREATAESRARLDAHLRDCAECRARLESWHATLDRLDRWQLPRTKVPMPDAADPYRPISARAAFASPWFGLLRWAAVVLVAALAGGIAGRWSTPPAPTAPPVPASVLHDQSTVGTSAEVLAALERLRKEDDARYLALRRDLETLATSTDAAIRQARRGLLQLAVHQSTETP